MAGADEIRDGFLAACRAELTALKPGNVHVHAGGHDMEVAQFERAAVAAAPFVAEAAMRPGERIRRAVEASMATAGCNTNLGILLLCVPLARAASSLLQGAEGRPLRAALRSVLDGFDMTDAAEVFRAIASANPGGLGRAAEADVSGPATVTLRQAMALAADRDRIARAYGDAYEDIFGFALPALAEARASLPTPDLAVSALHMRLLAAFPDSHIARKYGASIAEGVRIEAASLVHLFQPRLAAGAVGEFLRFDRSLKDRGLNPGTTADFVVATLFAEQLESRLGSAKNAT